MLNKGSLLTELSIGVLCGIFTSALLCSLFSLEVDHRTPSHFRRLSEEGRREQDTIEADTYSSTSSPDDSASILAYDYSKIGEEVARELASEVRVLCWVATMPSNHLTKAVVIRDTWGKRCNKLLFMSSSEDNQLPVVNLNVNEGRAYLFDKTKAAMKHVYDHHPDSFDWILKADDDTFVVVENLRYLLSKFNHSEALYLGCRFRPFTKQGFMSGGAGYVLSKPALKKFVQDGIGENGECLNLNSNGEDVLMGICMERLNVTAVDTRDDLERGRFFPYGPDFHLFPDHRSGGYSWYWDYQYYPDSEGLDCCSDSAVSFHYISPDQLYVMDYLVYTLKRFGSPMYTYRTAPLKIAV